MKKHEVKGKRIMPTNLETINIIESQIKRTDTIIKRHIDNLEYLGRGAVSQDILLNLRTFVEHVMFRIYASSVDIAYDYEKIEEAIKYVKRFGQFRFIWRFHAYLQIVVSHYSLDPEDSERVMLKYYEFLIKIKDFLENNFNLIVLENIYNFPLDLDRNLQEYYEKISEKLIQLDIRKDLTKTETGRYYIHKIKPFFINHRIFYEVTFYTANGKSSKFDRIIAFTSLDLVKNYAVKLTTLKVNIKVLDKDMSIYLILSWEVAIRPIEIEKLSNIFGGNLKNYSSHSEARGLMDYLTETKFSLVEILSFDDDYYNSIRRNIIEKYNSKASHFFDILDKCREIINKNRPGSNILRYLLYHLNNEIITDQLNITKNYNLSELYLQNGCIPFEEMPFSTSLLNHNPKLFDLFDCIKLEGRMHEILAKYILLNSEREGRLYTPKSELTNFGDVSNLVNTFNDKLYRNENHQARRIVERNDHYYIIGREEDTVNVLKKLISLSKNGVLNYSNFVNSWLISASHSVDCEEKKEALKKMFTKSSVAMIYGSAGTGKSTLIDHISNLFKNLSRLYLANTNPAVENMKRRVSVQNDNTDFMTISKFLKRHNNRTNYDIVFVDECSFVNNKDMKDILTKAKFEILVLVGDIYQIQSINFGNWFSAAKGFLPDTSIFELKSPYRSRNNLKLQTLWDKVREMDDTILEVIARNKYSTTLDSSIFESVDKDEVVLSLNYDGLYGINNINKFLQEANSNPPFEFGLLTYKVGDPVLFNDSERFSPVIYNNIKGWIHDIQVINGGIRFEIEIDKVINGLEVRGLDLELISCSNLEHSLVRFTVEDYRQYEEHRDVPITAIMPFQIAYSISIHKAQGLEFNSVKIVITDEIEDHISHSIFYTAITRSTEKLKIYWSPEIEQRILSNIMPRNHNKDIALLKQII